MGGVAERWFFECRAVAKEEEDLFENSAVAEDPGLGEHWADVEDSVVDSEEVYLELPEEKSELLADVHESVDVHWGGGWVAWGA